MALRSVAGLFDDAGNSDLPIRSIQEDLWDRAFPKVGEGEVLVALYWSKPGSNEEMEIAVIEDKETLKELHSLPERLWQCWAALSREKAKEIGLL